jgi:hypothetical protein
MNQEEFNKLLKESKYIEELLKAIKDLNLAARNHERRIETLEFRVGIPKELSRE